MERHTVSLSTPKKGNEYKFYCSHFFLLPQNIIAFQLYVCTQIKQLNFTRHDTNEIIRTIPTGQYHIAK
jgi:hypothetical protein